MCRGALVLKWRMLPTEPSPTRLRDDFMFVVGCALVAAVVLYFAGDFLRMLQLTAGQSVHVRLEVLTQSIANVVYAGLLLAAVVAFMFVDREHDTRVRPVAIAVVILAGIVIALAIYQVFDSLTRHIPSVDSSGAVPFSLDYGSSLADRLIAVFPALGTLVVAIAALIGANRVGNVLDAISGSRGTSDGPPGISEVE
jgi:hypothetical protein